MTLSLKVNQCMGHHVKSSKWNFYCYLTFMNNSVLFITLLLNALL